MEHSEEKQSQWSRFADRVELLNRRGARALRKLGGAELARLIDDYQVLIADLARARSMGADHATVALKWERLQVPIRITVDDMKGLYVANLKQEFRNAQAFKWQTYRDAAIYCLTNKTSLDQGLAWAQEAVSRPGTGVESMQTLSVVAELQLAMGNKEEGMKTMDRALAHTSATPVDIHQVARFQQMQGDRELAKKYFQLNAKRFPNQWPVNLGMARYYNMMGDNKQAVTWAKKALPQAPDEGNRKNIEGLITQWRAAPAAAASTK